MVLKIKNLIPENVFVHHCELSYDGHYSNIINTGKMSFDLVIIDGRDRVNCIKYSINKLSEMAVVILDNSERKESKPGIDFY